MKIHITTDAGEVIDTLDIEFPENADRIVICACSGNEIRGEGPSMKNQVDHCYIPVHQRK